MSNDNSSSNYSAKYDVSACRIIHNALRAFAAVPVIDGTEGKPVVLASLIPAHHPAICE